jgi:hypothetical protein
MTKEELMTKEEAIRMATETLQEFRAFDRECEEREYTDTCDAWDVMHDMYYTIKELVKVIEKEE